MDADHHAGDLLGAFRLEHLEALMPAHDIPRDLVPDDGIHIPEIVQGAPDFLVSWVARLQILAGIIFCRFQHENGHFLNVYFRLYRWQKAHKINPFERPGAIFLRSEKTLYFCEIFHGRAPRSRRKRSRRFDPPWGRKADHAPGLSPSKVQKPTAPRDFCTAKCESRQRPGLCCGEVRKPTSLPGVSHGEARKPTRAQDFFTAKRKSRPRRPDFFTAKRESRLCRRTLPRRSAKADCAAGLSLGEVRKPTTPQDFSPAKCKSRPARSDFFTAKRKSRLRRSSFPGPGFWSPQRPRRPRRRGERCTSL